MPPARSSPRGGDDVLALARYVGGSVTPPVQHTLTVSKSGAGSGTVTSSPAGISCGATCSHTYNSGTQITLSATPAAGSTFTGFSGGGCSGASACTLTLGSDQSVTASFAQAPPPPPKAPNTKIIKAKIDNKKGSAKFTLKATGDSTGFQCALAKKPKHGKPKLHFKSCHSPKSYKHLKTGHYTFEVRAKDPGGTDKSPAKKQFTIK